MTENERGILMQVAAAGYGNTIALVKIRAASAKMDNIDFGIAISELITTECLFKTSIDTVYLSARGWQAVKKLRHQDS